MATPKYLQYLQVYNCNKKIRLGSNNDGGYVIADLNDGYDCYISAGVSDEESFSRDFINLYKTDYKNSFAFDGTILRYPTQYTRNISFIRKNIAPYSSRKTRNLSVLIDSFDSIFLKMDIEGSEYNWINSLSTEQLKKFKQIVIEFHGINDDSWNIKFADKEACFEKLANTHYLVHAHANNYETTTTVANNLPIPNVIELTYVNKNILEVPSQNTDKLPCSLDRPNCSSNPDINLSFYPFYISS